MKSCSRSALFAFLICLFTVILLFTACGKEDGTTTSTAPSMQTSASPISTSLWNTTENPTISQPVTTKKDPITPPISAVTTKPTVTTSVTTAAVTSTIAADTSLPLPTTFVLPEINDLNGLLWYEFKEANGCTVLKSSLSQPRDSILFSGSIAEENGNRYAVFSGSGDGIKLNNTFTDFNQINDGTFLHPAADKLAVSFKFRPESLDTAMLFEYGSQYRGFAIAIIDGELTASITAANDPNTDGKQKFLPSYTLPEEITTAWNELVFIFNGSQNGGKATLYLNGEKIAVLKEVGRYLPQVLDASGVATASHGTNSLFLSDADYIGDLDDLRIYQSALIQIPTLENGALYLQSAAFKNHYLYAAEGELYCDTMIEPALRGVFFEQDPADSRVLIRFSETDTYVTALNGLLAVTSRKSAFIKESPLALPPWGEEVADAFISLRLADSDKYIALQGSSVVLLKPTTDAEKLACTFKLTEDQTQTLENLVGTVYYPSYALNAPQFFKWYDSAIIDRDMTYAENLGVNAFRIWVSYEYWLENPTHFEASYNDFLTLADAHGIKIMVSLFEGCGLDSESYDSPNTFSRDYTKAWSITSPSKAIYTNPARFDEPKAFVTWFFDRYKNDDRHMAIEIYNEPWGARESLAKYLSEYAVTQQGTVPITFGTAPAGSYNVVYSIEAGADMIHYHDNFPSSTDAFYQNAKKRIEQGRLANLPVYCTEVQWVGGPAGINYPVYRNLAPTVNQLSESGVWAPFWWTLMVHPCYLDSYRNNYKMHNGIIQEDGSFYAIANAEAIFPNAELQEAIENNHNPFTDGSYTYRHLFSDDFSDNHGYKWSVKNGRFASENSYYAGQGISLANATDFENFSATFTVTFEKKAGLIFRAQDENNYYLAELSETAYSLYKVVNGQKNLLASKTPEAAGTTVTLTVYADGSSLRLSANCIDCTADDSDFSSGAVGFYADETANFDSLLVKAITE